MATKTATRKVVAKTGCARGYGQTLRFKVGYTTAQTPIDRAEFASCVTGNPSYSGAYDLQAMRQVVVTLPATYPATLGSPERNERVKMSHDKARAEGKARYEADHTCVDCGTVEGAMTRQMRDANGKMEVSAILCAACLAERYAAREVAKAAERAAAHCTACLTVLVAEPGLCRFCAEATYKAIHCANCDAYRPGGEETHGYDKPCGRGLLNGLCNHCQPVPVVAEPVRELAAIAGGSGEDDTYIGCDFQRAENGDTRTCNRRATHAARNVRGQSDITLNCCDACTDRAKRRGYTLQALTPDSRTLAPIAG